MTQVIHISEAKSLRDRWVPLRFPDGLVKEEDRDAAVLFGAHEPASGVALARRPVEALR